MAWKLEKYMVSCLWAKKVQILVSPVNVHKRVTSAEEGFNTEVDRVTHSVVPASLFPQPPLISPYRLMNKVSMVTGMEVMHVSSNTHFH